MAPEPTPGGEPMAIPLVPDPAQTEWTKVCGTDPATEAEICYTTRDFVTEEGEPVMLSPSTILIVEVNAAGSCAC